MARAGCSDCGPGVGVPGGSAAPGPLSQDRTGRVVRILDATYLDFSYVAAGGSEAMRLAAGVDVSGALSAELLVRLHMNRLESSRGATVVVSVYPSAPTALDPRSFTSTTADGSVTINDVATDAAPKLFQATMSTINGPYYVLELEANQAAGASYDLALQLSVDLLLHDE